ncbi:probable family 17 glucosidase Scw4p [Monosporozyma servazzii]
MKLSNLIASSAILGAAIAAPHGHEHNNKRDVSVETLNKSTVKGITYSPYNADGTCKSADQVASDLANMKQYPAIRLYGVDCSQVENVMMAKQSNQKLFLGIYFMDQIEQGVETIKNAVNQYGSWDDVSTVSIGNELVNSNQATPSQVGGYISAGKSALQAAGYNGPVVSVDTFIAVINNPELCQYSDYMAVNAHAFFDQNTAAQDSGSWLLQQIQRVWSACDGNKNVVITESGWPSKGQTYGLAVPSKENQNAAIESITSTCGDDTFLYNAYNDYWKADGNLGVEKYWGILSDE